MAQKKHKKEVISITFSKMLHKILFATLLIIVAIMIASYIYIVNNHNNLTEIIPTYYNVTDTCTLSLCDCQCYKSNELPELTNHRICGSDCLTHYGIKGCQRINNICEPVFDFQE